MIVTDKFYPKATQLRTQYDLEFSNPLDTRQRRFCWDYWYVEDQYKLIRTPASHYFSKKTYLDFHKHLVLWGRKNLGCWDISPPWLSYYISGCEQKMHSDVPHGPWAFVYSLTLNPKAFSGGETFLLKPWVLDYWQNFGTQTDRELHSFMDFVSPKFNRLIVFDPRRPHGVTPVAGVDDPKDARLVIHGWFTTPQVYIDGPLPKKQTTEVLNFFIESLLEFSESKEIIHGALAFQIQVNAKGQVSKVKVPTNTLVTLDTAVKNTFLKKAHLLALELQFPKAQGLTLVTLPIMFS